MNVADDADEGYILEVDLLYPDHLHEIHKDYPLAAEPLMVTEEMLSPFSKSFGRKHVDSQKLIPNLKSKYKYTLHNRNLKLYVQLGLVVTKVHRVLTFSQRPWMKNYIDMNTKL
jgi:hypothetical protein